MPLLPNYQHECGACHLAYPPGLLPAASWQRLMANLPRHFGTDASLDAVAGPAIANWLTANAGTYKKVREAPPQDRISRADWFVREHREVGTAVWQRPADQERRQLPAPVTRARPTSAASANTTSAYRCEVPT